MAFELIGKGCCPRYGSNRKVPLWVSIVRRGKSQAHDTLSFRFASELCELLGWKPGERLRPLIDAETGEIRILKVEDSPSWGLSKAGKETSLTVKVTMNSEGIRKKLAAFSLPCGIDDIEQIETGIRFVLARTSKRIQLS